MMKKGIFPAWIFRCFQKNNNSAEAKNSEIEEKTPFRERLFPQDFWKSYTLDELAQMQKVKPVTDVRKIVGTWPGEVDDGFESAIDELRHNTIITENLP